MFARNVSVRLKPGSLAEFRQTLEQVVLPILRKQKGFQDEVTFAVASGTTVVAISLWDNQESAEAYDQAGYPEVLKSLATVLDGSPKVRFSGVVSSAIPGTPLV